MANMVSYKRVSGDIAEAKKIHALLQEDLTKQLPELGKDMRALTAASALVAKWDQIVTDLEAPDAPPNPAKVIHDAMTGSRAHAAAEPEGGDAKAGKPGQKKP